MLFELGNVRIIPFYNKEYKLNERIPSGPPSAPRTTLKSAWYCELTPSFHFSAQTWETGQWSKSAKACRLHEEALYP